MSPLLKGNLTLQMILWDLWLRKHDSKFVILNAECQSGHNAHTEYNKDILAAYK